MSPSNTLKPLYSSALGTPSDNSLTFTSYRTHVERLLLWALIIKPMYLRVSDIVGRPNWHPVMGDFR